MCPPSPLGFGIVAPRLDCSEVVRLLERQRDDGWQLGAQCYVSLEGETLLDVAVGEAQPGQPLAVDDIMLWYSSGKPLTTVAVLQLWEQGRLGLDDRVGDFIDGWGGGQGALHDPPRAHPHRRVPDVPRPGLRPGHLVRRCHRTHRRVARDVGTGHRGRVPPGDRLEGLGRDRRSGRRPTHRALRARRSAHAARPRLDVPRDPARRNESSARASCRWRGRGTRCRSSTTKAH